MVVVEVCVESAAGVRAARAAGAQRVELCTALSEGGLTPSFGAIEGAIEQAEASGGCEVIVLLRPRGGDFLYAEAELTVLERDIDQVRMLGASGVALGCLTASGAVDEPACRRLIERAQPLAVTFHRAFDLLAEPEQALETLVRLGVRRVLSSGQAASAHEGRVRLGALVRRAAGRVEVVAAGGVRPENVRALVAESGVRAVHLSAAGRRESAMEFRNPLPRLSGARASEEYAHWETDEERVRALLLALGDARA